MRSGSKKGGWLSFSLCSLALSPVVAHFDSYCWGRWVSISGSVGWCRAPLPLAFARKVPEHCVSRCVSHLDPWNLVCRFVSQIVSYWASGRAVSFGTLLAALSCLVLSHLVSCLSPSLSPTVCRTVSSTVLWPSNFVSDCVLHWLS